jgi:hypothetical protein
MTAIVERNCRQFEAILIPRCAAKKSARNDRGLNVALRIYPATLLVAIAAVLGMAAIANAIQDVSR